MAAVQDLGAEAFDVEVQAFRQHEEVLLVADQTLLLERTVRALM